MDKITKLPWAIRYENQFQRGSDYTIGQADDLQNEQFIATTWNSKADAEYICRAVNNHERLLEIAKAYLKTLNPKFLDYQKIEKVINAVDGEEEK